MRRHLSGYATALALGASILGARTVGAVESFIIVDNQTGKILASKNANDRRQVASLTKVATAVVVLDWAQVSQADMNQLATVSPAAMAVGGINPAGLQAGDQISLRDLLYSALMASDNIAAATLASHVGGRLPRSGGGGAEENFVAQMNALAANLGMRRTRFANPTGLDNVAKNPPFSTAADMARLARYAYTKPAFPFYVSQKRREIHPIRDGVRLDVWIENTNPILDQLGIDGIKTGRTARAGDCIMLTADRNPEARTEGRETFLTPRRITAVLLGCGDRAQDGLSSINRGWQLYDRWAAGGRKVTRSDTL